MQAIQWAERGWVPDLLVRWGIRRLLAQRRRRERVADPEARTERDHAFLAELRASPIAVETAAANEQHYEVPAEFFRRVLGPRLKYSCCLFPTGQESLAAAEEAMLDLTCRRAAIEDGLEILELGCGWGSLTLWMAQQYPGCRITAVSNSHGQREFILQRCADAGCQNVQVVTADMREFHIEQTFDRVVSVEMFEHMRNYGELLHRIAGWLRPAGKLFVHVFCHRETSYFFETAGDSNWMGRHFFTGGLMPSDQLLLYFQNELVLERHWRIEGRHYWRTCEAWLRQQDAQREALLQLFARDMPPAAAAVLYQRWRMFFLACAELFRYRGGSEWFVAHYLFQQRQ